MDISGSIRLAIAITGTKAVGIINALDPYINANQGQAYTDGAGADKAEQMYHDQRTLADGANEELDLAGVLEDAFGDVITFTKIKALFIYNSSEDASLIIGGAAATAWEAFVETAGDSIKLPPGGRLLIEVPTAAGMAVGAGTADLLKLTHDGTGTSTLVYDIMILGEGTVA